MTGFLDLVAAEVERATVKHPAPMHSLHEGYAVILEELEKFWDEVRKQNGARSSTALLEELVHVAAMCMRTAQDLGYTDQPVYEPLVSIPPGSGKIYGAQDLMGYIGEEAKLSLADIRTLAEISASRRKAGRYIARVCPPDGLYRKGRIE